MVLLGRNCIICTDPGGRDSEAGLLCVGCNNNQISIDFPSAAVTVAIANNRSVANSDVVRIADLSLHLTRLWSPRSVTEVCPDLRLRTALQSVFVSATYNLPRLARWPISRHLPLTNKTGPRLAARGCGGPRSPPPARCWLACVPSVPHPAGCHQRTTADKFAPPVNILINGSPGTA